MLGKVEVPKVWLAALAQGSTMSAYKVGKIWDRFGKSHERVRGVGAQFITRASKKL